MRMEPELREQLTGGIPQPAGPCEAGEPHAWQPLLAADPTRHLLQQRNPHLQSMLSSIFS